MFPSWWPKLRHSGMSEAMLKAYSALRIMRALARVSEAHGRMHRKDLASCAREIGNAVRELGYIDIPWVVSLLDGDRRLYDSICDTRHILAHDENAVPAGRLVEFFLCAPSLFRMAEALLSDPEAACQIERAEKYLMDDSDPEVEFDPECLRMIPCQRDDFDYAALCHAAMIKDVEWMGDDPCQRAADFLVRSDMILSIWPLPNSAPYPHKPSGKARAVLLSDSPVSERMRAAKDFLAKCAPHALACVRKLLKAKGVMPLVLEFSQWIDANPGKFRKLRLEFYRGWLTGGGRLANPREDSLISGTLAAIRKAPRKAGPRP